GADHAAAGEGEPLVGDDEAGGEVGLVADDEGLPFPNHALVVERPPGGPPRAADGGHEIAHGPGPLLVPARGAGAPGGAATCPPRRSKRTAMTAERAAGATRGQTQRADQTPRSRREANR